MGSTVKALPPVRRSEVWGPVVKVVSVLWWCYNGFEGIPN